jgi:hypothetical protein
MAQAKARLVEAHRAEQQQPPGRVEYQNLL